MGGRCRGCPKVQTPLSEEGAGGCVRSARLLLRQVHRSWRYAGAADDARRLRLVPWLRACLGGRGADVLIIQLYRFAARACCLLRAPQGGVRIAAERRVAPLSYSMASVWSTIRSPRMKLAVITMAG